MADRRLAGAGLPRGGTHPRNRLLMCAVLACGAFGAASRAAPAPRTHVIVIENMRFDPPTLTAHRGDRVRWVNKDMFPHTASASGAAFDSQSIAPGASWTYTVTEPGTYPYVCRFHPGMQGALIVQ